MIFETTVYNNNDLIQQIFSETLSCMERDVKNITKAKIELISDLEMYRKVGPNIRGNICHASVKYARENNKFLIG